MSTTYEVACRCESCSAEQRAICRLSLCSDKVSFRAPNAVHTPHTDTVRHMLSDAFISHVGGSLQRHGNTNNNNGKASAVSSEHN
ncbi:unnamed protein product [Arctogadus glacialis]